MNVRHLFGSIFMALLVVLFLSTSVYPDPHHWTIDPLHAPGEKGNYAITFEFVHGDVKGEESIHVPVIVIRYKGDFKSKKARAIWVKKRLEWVTGENRCPAMGRSPEYADGEWHPVTRKYESIHTPLYTEMNVPDYPPEQQIKIYSVRGDGCARKCLDELVIGMPPLHPGEPARKIITVHKQDAVEFQKRQNNRIDLRLLAYYWKDLLEAYVDLFCGLKSPFEPHKNFQYTHEATIFNKIYVDAKVLRNIMAEEGIGNEKWPEAYDKLNGDHLHAAVDYMAPQQRRRLMRLAYHIPEDYIWDHYHFYHLYDYLPEGHRKERTKVGSGEHGHAYYFTEKFRKHSHRHHKLKHYKVGRKKIKAIESINQYYIQ